MPEEWSLARCRKARNVGQSMAKRRDHRITGACADDFYERAGLMPLPPRPCGRRTRDSHRHADGKPTSAANLAFNSPAF